jgi:hypothetical protein
VWHGEVLVEDNDDGGVRGAEEPAASARTRTGRSSSPSLVRERITQAQEGRRGELGDLYGLLWQQRQISHGKFAPAVDFFWISHSRLHPGVVSTYGRISLLLFGRLLSGEFPYCCFMSFPTVVLYSIVCNNPRIRLVKMTSQLKQGTVCLQKSEKKNPQNHEKKGQGQVFPYK